MNTSDKRPRRAAKSAKSTVVSAASQADNGAAPAANPNGAPGAAGAAGLKKKAAAASSDVAPPAESASIKAVRVTVSSRHREDRHASIAKAAYFRAEMRGFAPGHEVEDWLAAEEEVDQRLLGEGRAS